MTFTNLNFWELYSGMRSRQNYDSYESIKDKLIEYEYSYSSFTLKEDKETIICSSGSELKPDGLFKVNLTNFLQMERGGKFTDDFNFSFTNISQTKSLLSRYTNFLFSYPTTKFIYNLYLNQITQGYIGFYNSIYSRIPLTQHDLLLRYFNSPLYVEKKYFSLDSDNRNREVYWKTKKHPNILSLGSNKWTNVWYHVPMYLNQPSLFLTSALRTLSLKLAVEYLNYDKHIFIGVCHQKKLKSSNAKRILVFSHKGTRLASMKVDSTYILMVKNILSEYNGYTNNCYFSWYYMPIVKPVEHLNLYAKADEALSKLPNLTNKSIDL